LWLHGLVVGWRLAVCRLLFAVVLAHHHLHHQWQLRAYRTKTHSQAVLQRAPRSPPPFLAVVMWTVLWHAENFMTSFADHQASGAEAPNKKHSPRLVHNRPRFCLLMASLERFSGCNTRNFVQRQHNSPKDSLNFDQLSDWVAAAPQHHRNWLAEKLELHPLLNGPIRNPQDFTDG